MIALEASGPGALAKLLDRLLPGLKPGEKVLVKPDWNSRETPRPGEVSTAPFLAELLGWLQGRGITDVAIAHSALLTPPDVPYTSLTDLIKAAGCNGLLEDFPHVKLLDLEVEPMELRGGFMMPRALREADRLIQCVRLKTHSGTQIAGATKGLMGLLPDSEHLRMHRDGLDALLAQLRGAIQPALTLVEADVGMEGEGPHHGDPVPCGFFLGGTDTYAVDAVCAQLMGYLPNEVGHLQGGLPVQLPVEMRPFARAFRRPKGVVEVGRSRVFSGDSCATCHLAAQSLLDVQGVREAAGIARSIYVDGVDLYMGHQPEGRTPGKRAVALGECARAFAERHGMPLVPGCPVRVGEARPALIEALKP